MLTQDGWREDLAVLVEGERIVALLPAADPQVRAARRHDLAGQRLLPGFIDCQVNGGGGVLFNATPSIAGIRTIAAAHRRHGTTGLLPTLISDSLDVMRAAIGAVDAAIAEGVPGVLGIHIEGPYIAASRKGVHHEAALRLPDAAEITLSASLRHGRTLLTLAPGTGARGAPCARSWMPASSSPWVTPPVTTLPCVAP